MFARDRQKWLHVSWPPKEKDDVMMNLLDKLLKLLLKKIESPHQRDGFSYYSHKLGLRWACSRMLNIKQPMQAYSMLVWMVYGDVNMLGKGSS